LVLKVTGSQTNVLFSPQSSGGVSRLCADLSMAAQKLNYKPSIPLEKGLKLTLQRDARFKTEKKGSREKAS
jgi:UDP-glucose 4-epimerase